MSWEESEPRSFLFSTVSVDSAFVCVAKVLRHCPCPFAWLVSCFFLAFPHSSVEVPSGWANSTHVSRSRFGIFLGAKQEHDAKQWQKISAIFL